MANVVSVKDYLAAYKPAYDAVKAEGTRKRGEKAYEDLFAVADRTDDMQEAQLIIEKEGLMLRLVTEDALDIHETMLAKLDPLDEVTPVLTSLNVDMYKNALSNEDIAYKSQLLDMQTLNLTEVGKLRMQYAASLADYLIKYDCAKRAVREWINDNKAKGGLEAMAKMRACVRKILEMASEDLETDWQHLMDNKFFSITMLCAKNMDGYGRLKETMHPDALDAYKDLMSEIMSDMSLIEILKKEQDHCMVYLPL